MSVVEDESGGSKLTFSAKGAYLIWRAPVRPMSLNSQLKVYSCKCSVETPGDRGGRGGREG